MSDITQFLGRLVPNTQCNYKLDNCSQRKCVVRSPHYPGLYPRNLACSYHIFVLPGSPSGKQANCRHTKIFSEQDGGLNFAWAHLHPFYIYFDVFNFDPYLLREGLNKNIIPLSVESSLDNFSTF